MDWALAIKRNRDQLRTIVLALFALAKMRVGGTLFTLPRSTFAMIMLVLRPAEACVRRLILIAACRLAPKPHISRLGDLPPRWGDARQDRGGRLSAKAFKLFDPLKHVDTESIWDAEPIWESGFDLAQTINHCGENPSEPLGATHLGQRLNALMRALDTLPAQARRLLRWQAKRDAALMAHRPTRLSPMRPGLPPGWRERKIHEIDDVLRECHGLANDLLNAPLDTS